MNENELLAQIKSQFELTGVKPNEYSPLTLAFIGDGVYGLVVKSVIVLKGNCPANELNAKTVRYVKAVSQAKVADYFINNDLLSEEEANIYRRGRNAKASSTAKNASVGDYRKATGLEALMGYLYLDNRSDRMIDLMRIGMDMLDGDN